MPTPLCTAGGSSFFGVSATMASVVIMRPATDAASCGATRATLRRVDDAGVQHVDILLGLGVEPEGLDLFSSTLLATIEPHVLKFRRIAGGGASAGVSRFPRYYEPLRHPRAPGLSLTGVRLVLSSLT